MTKNAKDEAQIRELGATVSNLTEENARLRQKLERMNELLLNAQRARFGQSSEKRSYVMEDGEQLGFFNEAEVSQNEKADEPTVESVTEMVQAHSRKKKRSQEELLAALPVEEILLEIPSEELLCEKCGGSFRVIGRKFLKTEMILIPQSIQILKYYANTYACDSCEKDTGYAHIKSVQPPPSLMKHSLASPSTVADVMTKKYVDGVPLARQEKIWARHGIALSRATMANWVIHSTQNWLKPLYRLLKKRLLTQEVIHADETVVQVLKEPDKSPSAESRMWIYASSPRSDQRISFFEYQPSRSGSHAAAFLKNFGGKLVTDGYSGYNKVEGAIRCGCWTHARRKWREAMPKGATVSTSKAAIGYQYCNKLFAYEKKIAEQSDTERKLARQAVLQPLLEAYWLWLDTIGAESGSKLYEAVNYSRNQRPYLEAFLEHGDVEPSNNAAENAIRPFALGRKNWLFCDSVKGADSSAIVYTLVETAKLNGIEPYRYLLAVLSLLPYMGKNPSYSELETLLPWHPQLIDTLRRSQG